MLLGGLDMGLSKVRIGVFVELYSETCGIPDLTVDDISGVNKDKEFFEPSKQVGADTSKYKIVPPGFFACNLMHVGRDEVLPIALNHTDRKKIVSPAYTIFRIKDESIIIKEYFFMFLKSSEKDRYFWFHTDSSIRDGMDWDTFCNVEIQVPSVEVQKKYVAIYQGMEKNAKAYRSGLEDLRLTCTAYIEELRRKMPLFPIGDYIETVKEKNSDNQITVEQGINIQKEFITPQRSNADLSSRVIVRQGQFAYCTQLNNENVAIAYRTGCDCVVSPVYTVFEITRKDELLPEYLLLWLIRPEFGRFVYWASVGSAYEFLQYENLAETKIPIPDIQIQQAIINIYNAYTTRKRIAEKMEELLNRTCPILVKGAVEEGGR